MYDDAPQELVHDLIAEAVFADHPLGRPVIGTSRGDLVDSPRVDRALPRHDVRPREHRRRSGRESRPRRGGRARHRTRSTGVPNGPPPARTFARRSCRRRRRGCASSRRTPSSTTSVWPRPGSRAPTGAGSPPRCSMRSSAARPRHGSSRRSARNGGWPTPSTRSSRSTPTRGRSASTSGRARTTSARRCRSRPSRSPTSPPATCPTVELERAKENLKGRILLSMESTSTRMNRLGKSLITDTELLSLDRIVAEIDAVETSTVAELAATLPGDRAPLGCLHRAERGAVPRGARADHADARSRRVKLLLNGRHGQGRLGARARARGARARARRLARRRRGDGRLHDTGRRSRERRSVDRRRLCPCVVGTSGWDVQAVARRAGRRVLRAELRARARC